MSDAPQISELIEKLGGGSEVAAALNAILPPDEKRVERDAVYKWKEANSIPAGRRLFVARLAIKAKLPLPAQLAEYGNGAAA